jgi:transcriptional regulator with XRE-family HTH domain
VPTTAPHPKGASRLLTTAKRTASEHNVFVILFDVDTGTLIRNARLSRGWTQADLASRLGTPQSAIARWERSSSSPRVETLERILSACGFQCDLQLVDQWQIDRDQLQERLSWSPAERLQYLIDMVAFEERARRARRIPA